jgi:hypothetical protein
VVDEERAGAGEFLRSSESSSKTQNGAACINIALAVEKSEAEIDDSILRHRGSAMEKKPSAGGEFVRSDSRR